MKELKKHLNGLKMKIGLVSDLANYKEYFNKFKGDKILEIHLLKSDLDKDFLNKLLELRQFIQDNEIEKIAFHTVDNIIQNVLFEEYKDEDLELYNNMVNSIKTFSNFHRKEVILIVHLGYKTNKLQDITELRKQLLIKSKKAYDKILKDCENSYIEVCLENSPPACASSDEHHVIDVCFEDINSRLGNHGFVLDISHFKLAELYYKQNEITFPAMDIINPYSLKNIKNYIKMAGNRIKWVHVSDSTGCKGEDEGKVVGEGLINFNQVIREIEKYAPNASGVLEILNSHNNFKLIEDSYNNYNNLTKTFIGNKEISNKRCYVIAEVASSHCGDKEKLKQIIALHSKVDGIKFQLFNADKLCSTRHPGYKDLKNIQIEDWNEILEYAKTFDVDILTDVFDENMANLAEKYVAAYSIHASDISNHTLLEHVAKKGKTILLYLGGSTIDEIRDAINVIEKYKVGLILVYGLQNFPTTPEDVNLNRIKYLKQEFNLPVCYHDHTDAETELSKDIAVNAFAFGANLIEKHVTDDRSLKGFDYMSSLNPSELNNVITKIREFERTLGNDNMDLHSGDLEYRKKMKKYIVASKDLKKGHVLTSGDISFKRTLEGNVKPSESSLLINRELNRDIAFDEGINYNDVKRKIVTLIPVRLKSKRLPMKAKAEIEGETSIGLMLERLKQSKLSEVILCTSDLDEDKELLEIASQKNVKSFSGSAIDVMDRFLKCVEIEDAEIIVRTTGDNPLMDASFIDRMIEFHLKEKADYTGVEDVPIGFNAEIFNVSCLKKAQTYVKEAKDTEYMTWFLKDPSMFKIALFEANENEKGQFRLTLDTPEDLKVIRETFKALGKNCTLSETITFLKQHSEITNLNQNYRQIKSPTKLK